jgi:hypothetical protein
MSDHNISPMDLGYEKARSLPPVPRLVQLILHQAVLDGADRIEFRLASESSEAGFQVTVRVGANESKLPPSAGSLFAPCMVVLCNHASVPYYAKGRVTGKLRTVNPASEWTLDSDDLQQQLSLSKT